MKASIYKGFSDGPINNEINCGNEALNNDNRDMTENIYTNNDCTNFVQHTFKEGNMKEATLIKEITKLVPEARPTPLSEFYEDDGYEGIWFRGSEDTTEEGLYIFDCYSDNDTGGVHPLLNSILENAGWYAEPYDSGTLMAYKN